MIKLLILNLSLFFICVGCTTVSAPLEFAPPPAVVERAIAFTLQSSYDNLGHQLDKKPATFEISKIDVKQIKPKIIYNLPVYHLEGIYQIKLKLNNNKTKTIKNKFQIDIQRRKKGETWRLLHKSKEEGKEEYFAYQIT
ncbi:hypothetical protein IQ215_09615 [Cyanobacterium stanieri LEGE 03274]|uniref:Lipoprotein n=1 Tax=Cyanobacterium stanieri LEGE 03274 TaxID=1828756 RepID=A0ABR9V4Y7_9CHRO|nr:hypothetical protein [Cyanobacterium stanieri]MBE9222950.1 hypothetical protein [Cyanobacterium stanieri LEGE 03274]